jgi:phage terminase large subunit GpA-like protein
MRPWQDPLERARKMSLLLRRIIAILRPSPKDPPDVWGAKNRTYPPTSGKPGPRDPSLTPYVVAFERAVASGRYKRNILAKSAQHGGTDGLLDIIGARLDQRPVPILYAGPTKDFVTSQFEPRLMALLDEAPSLKAKVLRGKKNKQTKKWVAGVKVRLAHGGSSAALKSDPFALAIVDEYDEMLADVKGQGDPLMLIEARGITYADFTAAIISTPSRGLAEVLKDELSGLEFWKLQDAESIESGIWKLWQEGTRHHWAWPCPQCD